MTSSRKKHTDKRRRARVHSFIRSFQHSNAYYVQGLEIPESKTRPSLCTDGASDVFNKYLDGTFLVPGTVLSA